MKSTWDKKAQRYILKVKILEQKTEKEVILVSHAPIEVK